jgi:glycosyltransferase involved in cell wall biosynthesis
MIFIPFDSYKNIGGVTTFMTNLRRYLDENSFSYQLGPEGEIKAVFFPLSYFPEKLKELKSKGVKVIQRLDGLYYPEKHGDNYDKNYFNQIKEVYSELADFVVFQSEYSKEQCFAILGEMPADKYEIIINGAFTDKFYPTRSISIEPDSEVKFVTTGNIRNIDMIEPLTKAFDSLVGEFKFSLTVVGPIPNPDLLQFIQRDYIKHQDSVNHEEIPDILREHHIFLYSHLNPPCPNSVIEAISAGMPVVGFDSGAMKELLHFAPELLAAVNDKIFQSYSEFNPDLLANKILLSVNEYQKYKELAIEHANDYNFDKAARKYVEVFNKFSN